MQAPKFLSVSEISDSDLLSARIVASTGKGENVSVPYSV